jgi:hypothetical protein
MDYIFLTLSGVIVPPECIGFVKGFIYRPQLNQDKKQPDKQILSNNLRFGPCCRLKEVAKIFRAIMIDKNQLANNIEKVESYSELLAMELHGRLRAFLFSLYRRKQKTEVFIITESTGTQSLDPAFAKPGSCRRLHQLYNTLVRG